MPGIACPGFCSPSDPGSDGSGFCSGSRISNKRNRNPKEKALKQEFMGRGYTKDAVSGRIHVEQPAQSRMMMMAIGQEQPSADATTPQASGVDVGPTAPSEISDPP